MLDTLESRFRSVTPNVTFCSLRYMHERQQMLSVRQNVPQPVWQAEDAGAMVTVIHKGGLGYAATSDLTVSGLRSAVAQAVRWAELSAGRSVTDFDRVPMPHPVGEYLGPEQVSWQQVPVADKMALLQRECSRLKVDDKIVDWEASLLQGCIEVLYLTNQGGRVYQRFSLVQPHLGATANDKSITQSRRLAGRGRCQQGGYEVLRQVGFEQEAPRIGQEAIELLSAPTVRPAGWTLSSPPTR